MAVSCVPWCRRCVQQKPFLHWYSGAHLLALLLFQLPLADWLALRHFLAAAGLFPIPFLPWPAPPLPDQPPAALCMASALGLLAIHLIVSV